MTIHIADYAIYQDGLSIAQIKAAGFAVVNFKVSHGAGIRNVHPQLPALVAAAKKAGLGLGTFHWLDGSASGADQAHYAYGRLYDLGLVAGAAHTVDVEEDDPAPTWDHVRDYVETMRALLGRPLMIYTGDWWWTAPGRQWKGSSLAPYVMAAPNDGYPGSYPGDASSAWTAGYGGWQTLSVMQYSDRKKVAGVAVSAAAVRDPAVWSALTGGPTVASQAYYNWRNDGSPWELCRPGVKIADKLRAHGYTVYAIGSDDPSHLQASTPEDHTPFSATGWPVKSPYGIIFAIDVMPPKAGQKSKLTGEPLPSLQQLGAQIVADKKAGVPGAFPTKYINWETERDNGGPCYQDGWTPGYYRVGSQDRGHIHWSFRSDTAKSTVSDDYDLAARAMGDDMSKEVVLEALGEFFKPAGQTSDGNRTSRIGRDDWDQSLPNPFFPERKTTAWKLQQDIATAVQALLAFARSEAAEVPASAKETADAVVAALSGNGPDDLAATLLEVLGQDKAVAVARIWIGQVADRKMAEDDAGR